MRIRRVTAIAVAGLAVALVALQFALPPLAEHQLTKRLEKVGNVQGVEVHAFPALKLLWHRADRVSVRMSSSETGLGKLADLLSQTRATDRLDVRVDESRVVTLTLTDVVLRKRGTQLQGSATVTEADLRGALPPGFDVRPIASAGGALLFEGTATILGRTVSARALAAVVDGRIVIAPDIPFGGLASLTVFSDDRVLVDSLGARAAPSGFTLTASAHLD